MHRLDRIRVAGFRSIKDQTVELRPLNLLIGANGSGKSNFIGNFRLLSEIVKDVFRFLWPNRVAPASYFISEGK